MPEAYVKRLNGLPMQPLKGGSLARDSSGFSTRLYEAWLKAGRGKCRRRAWLKLHILVALSSPAMLSA
ncbi:MAG: hypothetical protein QW057_02570 [Candidatus Bathyarchaeia archaeon]